MKKKLEADGWKIVGYYGGYIIYALGDDRILYNPEKDCIHLKYTITDLMTLLYCIL